MVRPSKLTARVSCRWSWANRILNGSYCCYQTAHPRGGFSPGEKLLVDLNSRRLVDSCTYNSIPATAAANQVFSLHGIENPSNKFTKLVSSRPALTTPTFMSKLPPKHGVFHHIKTDGPPLCTRARRLAPDRLAIAKESFREMEAMGVIRRYNSQWPSALNVVPKPCGG